MQLFKRIIFVLVTLIGISTCQNADNERQEQEEATLLAESLPGKALAQIHCGGCHKLPDPELLDKPTWANYILPRMGYMLGIYPDEDTRRSLFEEGPGGSMVAKMEVYPEKPTISKNIWDKIQAYYLENAPQQLPEIPQKEITVGIPGFELIRPSFQLSPPSATMVKFGSAGNIWLGDANTKALYQLDNKLNVLNAANTNEGAVWMEEDEQNYYVTVMGSFSPTDAPNGLLLELPKAKDKSTRVLLKNLQRPVHSVRADLNDDGKMDFITCEFAKWTGSLSWWKQLDNGGYQRNILKQQPGATKAYLEDMDHDGRKDIIALFGQGNEGVWIFYNEGEGNFREEQVLALESSYGSSYLSLFDYNGDGHLDFIYTAGDNADYPPVLKPYHGIRIFENDGKNAFSEVFFYQLNGAYNAIPNDFDGDGDMDIAAISFFPDFQEQPEEGFVFLQNQGNLKFKAFTFEEVSDGRWIVMDGKDMDSDGDMDLILGSLAFEVVPPMGLVNKWVELGLPFVILENKQK